MESLFHKTMLGESVILYKFASCIEKNQVLHIQSIYHRVKQLDFIKFGILDVVPSYCDLALYCTEASLLLADDSILVNMIQEEFTQANLANQHSKTHEILVDYCGEDLPEVLNYYQMNRDELISLHSSPQYLIAMLGFKPYFPYLLGLNEKLFIPRRSSPRLFVKRGAVAIGGEQTGIYTSDSPGGWHIIGYTRFAAFEQFRPGDYIKFVNSLEG